MIQARSTTRLALALWLATAGAATASDPIDGTDVAESALAWGSGNKMEVGRYNSLHAVYARMWEVLYVTSLDGDDWTTPISLSTGWYEVDTPAIAVDSSGRPAVVWWEDDGTPGGMVYYAFRPLGSTVFQVSPLALGGRQPAITARGSNVYVTWSNGNAIQYTSFPTITPPGSPLLIADVVESTTCPGTQLLRPAITTVRESCRPVPKIAYLVVSDEQASSGSCQSSSTRVGAVVESLNGSWSPVYDGTVLDADPGSAVAGWGLSLSSHYVNRDLYLAWSDENSTGPRTMLAQGRDANWATSPYDSERHHVHVRANNFSWGGTGQFRLALATEDGFDWDALWRQGTWSNAGALSLPGSGSPVNPDHSVRLPQVQFWRICHYTITGSSFLRLFYEEETPLPWTPPQVATDFWSHPMLSCGYVAPVLQAYPCLERRIAMAGVNVAGGEGTAIDVSELGLLTKVGDAGATVTTVDGKTVTISWSGGRPVHADEAALLITAPRSQVRFSSRDVTFSVEDDGYLAEYDEVR
ncbi:MAG TPA: hypothetical protein VF017_19035 [Thermoanaerobaculia bacterium]|nr:hypothetical protein [Thermoanaerobaculia bacterium]